jgi:lactoylglutathione lyase
MRYLHTMVRVRDLDASLRFYCDGLGLKEVRRVDNEKGRFTLVFLAAPEDIAAAGGWREPPGGPNPPGIPCMELTYNWDVEDYGGARNFGHQAYLVDDIYAACERFQKLGVTISRPPRDGHMAFVRSPDNISIELLQKGERLPAKEPWVSMPNVGAW